MSQAVTNLDAKDSISGSWRNHLMALAAVVALILVEFHDAVSQALNVWVVSPTYSHCFLILPIVAWLVWEKRGVLQKTSPVLEPRVLLLILPLLAVWLLGELSAVNEIRQYAVVAMLQVAIVALLGGRIVRQLWFPVLFLLFLVPTGEYLIGPMQRFATRFVDISLNGLNIPHYTEGTVIELTNGKFQIAEACAGLRFLIATVTLGVLFAYLMYQRVYKVVLFLLASVLIPLIGNGLRCVGIILITHYTNNEYGAGADHIVYGWGFNVAILLVLIFTGSLFRDGPVPSSPAPAPGDRRKDAIPAIIGVAALSGLLVSVGPAWALWRDRASATLDRSVIQEALTSQGWREAEPGDWHPSFAEADARFLEERTAEDPVTLFIGYYARPRAGRTIVAHVNQPWDDEVWNPSAGTEITAKLGSATAQWNEYVISSGFGKRLVWFTYWSDDALTNNPLLVRLLQAKAALDGHDSQAIIAVSTPWDRPADVVRGRLRAALLSLAPLPTALGNAASSHAQRAH